MAKSYEEYIYGHNSIYMWDYLKENYKKRKIKIKYSFPDKGVNSQTGIVLLISGYGANSSSKVYVKMRNVLADLYNLVTIQCDYFGYEFIQDEPDGSAVITNYDIDEIKKSIPQDIFDKVFDNKKVNIKELINSNIPLPRTISINITLNETIENFNDMGIMQALDNITATLQVIDILKENNNSFNSNKVIIMGNSHGAYLGYLCNAMCRNLYTHILDNSAWVEPSYYDEGRILKVFSEKFELIIRMDYNCKNLALDIEPLKINELYKGFFNDCNIVIYHGENDTLISADNKYEAIKNINNISFNLIRENDVDNRVFYSSSHGLDADFIKLFDKFYKEYCNVSITKRVINIEEEIMILNKLIISYRNIIPEVNLYE